MPIARKKIVKCPKCRKKVLVLIGDVMPQVVTCMMCGYKWVYKRVY